MSSSEKSDVPPGTLRKAAVVDVPEIHKLIMHYANKRRMLPVSLSRLYECVRDFFVYELKEGTLPSPKCPSDTPKSRSQREASPLLVACGALHVLWEDLAEVRSVAVRQDLRGKGIGRVLVEACKEEAKALRIPRVFCLTYSPRFFQHLGFREVDKASLPHKIWADCINCPQFPDCAEVPLVCELTPPEGTCPGAPRVVP